MWTNKDAANKEQTKPVMKGGPHEPKHRESITSKDEKHQQMESQCDNESVEKRMSKFWPTDE